MKKVMTGGTGSSPAEVPQMFGLNVIKVSEKTAKTPPPLLKPVEDYTNLTVSVLNLYPRTLFSQIDSGLNLGRFTGLRSLRFEDLSFIDCDYEPSLKKIAEAFKSLSQLRSLTFCKAFQKVDSDDNVKAAVMRLFTAGLPYKELRLEELQFHYNDMLGWDYMTWVMFGSLFGPLKRFSLKVREKLGSDNSYKLCEYLRGAKNLVSCEIQIPEFENWDVLFTSLSSTQMRILEIGDFNWYNAKDREIIEKIFEKFPALQSLGLKMRDWNRVIAEQLFDLIRRKGKNLSQLVIDTRDNEHDIESLKSHLSKTNLLDVRFVLGDVDRTPAEVTNLCIEKTQACYQSIQDKKGIVGASQFIAITEEFMSRLCVEYSSVPVLRHQINMMMHCFLNLIVLDISKKTGLSQFVAKLSQWIEDGKVSYDFILRLFENSWDVSQHDNLLTLLPAVMKGCNNVDEIEKIVKPRFMEILNAKSWSFGSLLFSLITLNFRIETTELNKHWIEVCAIEEMISDAKYHMLLSNLQRYDELLFLNILKQVLSDRLGQKEEYVKDFIQLNSKEFLQTEDRELFSAWITKIMVRIVLLRQNNESYCIKLLRTIFGELKTTEKLLQAREVFPNIDNSTSFCLELSLVVLRWAIQNGYQDNENRFNLDLQKYLKETGKSFVEAMGEIDQLVGKIFKAEEPAIKPVVVELKSSESTPSVRVPLKDLLKAKKEEGSAGDKQARPSLKDRLKAKKELEAASLGKFFDEQSRDGAGEGKDVGEGASLN